MFLLLTLNNYLWDNLFSYDDLEISLLYVYKKSNFKRTKM